MKPFPWRLRLHLWVLGHNLTAARMPHPADSTRGVQVTCDCGRKWVL